MVYMMNNINYDNRAKELFNTAILAGELLAKYGAETYRVEETMIRILSLASNGRGEAMATLTGFSVSFNNTKYGYINAVRRISDRRQRFDKIILVNEISRKLCNGEIALSEAHKKLEEINKEKDKIKEIKKNIGLTFQYPENQLFEETIFKEISFGPKNLGIKDDELEERVKKAMEMVEMDYTTYKDRSPFTISGGEMRRVAIASILSIDPEVIILDEPTASLDPLNKKSLLKLISKLHLHYHKTIVLVSHNMEVIAELAQRIIVMDKGKIVLDNNPKQIFQNHVEELESIGLSLPQITYIMHKLKKIGKPVDSGILTLEEAKNEILRVTKRI